MPNYTKFVHFYLLITLKHKKVVVKFVKNLFYGENTHLLNGHNMSLVHIGIASMRTEIKETYFEIYTKQASCPLAFSFKHLKLPISVKIPVTIWQIVYIYMTAISPILFS